MAITPNLELCYESRRAPFESANMQQPYSFPASGLSANLVRVHSYWKGLLRGAARIPFSDDLNLSDLVDLIDRVLLLDVFEWPERFRFNEIGEALDARSLTGKFIDEVTLRRPFEFLRSQCSATVEAAAPSYYRQEDSGGAYARLLLPLWGEGRINMLLGMINMD
jgi:hypothetical protein